MTTTTSRRAILAGIAATPAIFTPAIALDLVAPRQTNPIFDLEAKIKAAWTSIGEVCDASDRAGKLLFAWNARNPKPKMRECEIYNIEWTEPGPITPEKYGAYARACLDANRDLQAAMREHEQAVRDWTARERAARRQSGNLRAKAAERLAHRRLDKLINQLRDAPASNLDELKAKARIQQLISEDAIADSIVADILKVQS